MPGKPIPKVTPTRPPSSRKTPGFVDRARRILFQPQREWEAINGEFTKAGAIYRNYIVPLSAIGPIASVAGVAVFGEQGTLFGIVQTPLGTAVQDAVAHYVLGLVSVFVVAIALELLAPSFSGQANRVQGLKVAAYASTPAWLFGILCLVPRLGPLALLGMVWTLYLVYSGAPLLMKVSKERATAFGLVAVVIAAIVALLFEGLTRAFV